MKIKAKRLRKTAVCERVICNRCGTAIEKNADGYFSDHLSVSKRWSFLSDCDNEVHNFDLCKSCYNEVVSEFKHAVH